MLPLIVASVAIVTAGAVAVVALSLRFVEHVVGKHRESLPLPRPIHTMRLSVLHNERAIMVEQLKEVSERGYDALAKASRDRIEEIDTEVLQLMERGVYDP